MAIVGYQCSTKSELSKASATFYTVPEKPLMKLKRNFLFLRSPIILLVLVLTVTIFLANQASYSRQYGEVTQAYSVQKPSDFKGREEVQKAYAVKVDRLEDSCRNCTKNVTSISRSKTVRPLPYDPGRMKNRAIVQHLADEKVRDSQVTKATELNTKVDVASVAEATKQSDVPHVSEIAKRRKEGKVNKAEAEIKGKEYIKKPDNVKKAMNTKQNTIPVESKTVKNDREHKLKPVVEGTKQFQNKESWKQVKGVEKTRDAKDTLKSKPVQQVQPKENDKNKTKEAERLADVKKSKIIEKEKVTQQVNAAKQIQTQLKAKEGAKDQTVAQKNSTVAKLKQFASNKEKYTNASSRVKYLIYLCDKKVHCYGLGDRQRAIVATYFLAELTNRRFGIIMTTPSNIRDFYEPNLVNWDIPESELPTNATTREIQAMGPKAHLHLDTIDFNVEYPEDIVYIRTNKVLWYSFLKNPIYKNRIPGWARIHQSHLIATGWLRLMKPTPLLRASLNDALIDIAQKIQEEAEVWKHLGKTRCCKKISLPKVLPACPGGAAICSKNMSSQACCDRLRTKLFEGCLDLKAVCSGIDSKSCSSSLYSSFPKRWDRPRTETLAHNFCTLPPPVSRLNGTIESIRRKQGFDLTDMNLVCAHIRLGHSKTFPFETHTFNKQQGVSGVWDFLKGFAQKGYHMYLASDAQEVKDEAKAIFGERLLMADTQIVHIAYVQQGQDQKAGMQ
ncbi:hypothetical protein PoB_004987900 [Plakobranchus ocellatus]|uniref:L-Fucosyltransferase n=1 Tax=Plakobranchus ocellatus TaxID=259542 RepID=A0AAV4BT62_9GAST|nr:hypothetical protein PoB_004987900 [Plakobranchus ocellatus]